ncbi:homocysteine S-methyltransferase family protein [Pseudoroseicyclus tamaricis]|uniref:Homocysteine S-methyltransferase n=1 Tax=Pseudoroseicyclus tamaricis TaxID=2705421 RepID=A0A6B2JZI3_9RHOB|nr:homocysteine S-methyltransferase family protein [Pseudoroseicyclus tamaricis]NDV00782.1 homocysteine S-methyltransferase [Pseudoroseicyclus tamaricis]
MTKSDHLSKLLAATRPWLADGGLETSMIYHEGFDLPGFAAYPLLDDARGRAALTRYYAGYVDLAARAGTGFFCDTATWRANSAWMARLGHSDVAGVNTRAVAFAQELRDAYETPLMPVLINGAVGPSGDGYVIEEALSAPAAEEVHSAQVQALAEAGVDLVTAVTMTYPSEAIGVVRAAQAAGVPVAVSFTVETDGRLPNGQGIGGAIAEVDISTDGAPVYYMVNCAHPDHFSSALSGGWLKRIGGLRANASRMSHAELDVSEVLDDGDPAEYGRLHAAMMPLLPNLKVLGGCCGTDHRHLGAVGACCLSAEAA